MLRPAWVVAPSCTACDWVGLCPSRVPSFSASEPGRRSCGIDRFGSCSCGNTCRCTAGYRYGQCAPCANKNTSTQCHSRSHRTMPGCSRGHPSRPSVGRCLTGTLGCSAVALIGERRIGVRACALRVFFTPGNVACMCTHRTHKRAPIPPCAPRCCTLRDHLRPRIIPDRICCAVAYRMRS